MKTPRHDYDADLTMFVVDVLRHDIEQIDSILNLLNNTGCIGWRAYWPCDFTRADVIGALRQLLDQGFVQPLEYDASLRELTTAATPSTNDESLSHYWFSLTDNGYKELAQWDPPHENGDAT